MKNDMLGNRMKSYELVSSHQLLLRTPVIIRVDGRAFHSLKLHKPFDYDFMRGITLAAFRTAKEMQGFKFGYIASDEVSFLLTDYDTITTESWFGYDLSKVVSISASLMTLYFHFEYRTDKSCFFDSRAFNIPEDDIANYFLWRVKDWNRNSLSMYCRSFFSHKELHLKRKNDMNEMLHSIDKNWSKDLNQKEKNGTFLLKRKNERGIDTIFIDEEPSYQLIQNLLNECVIKEN